MDGFLYTFVDVILRHEWSAWIAFLLFVSVLVGLDLFVFNRKLEVPSFGKSLAWTGFYVFMSLLFGYGITQHLGQEKGLEFYTGYLMELSLSMDNVFVISMIFRAMAVPPQFQHRVLFWGIIGVFILRGTMIALGAALVAKFHVVLALFGAFLIFTGFKMLFSNNHNEESVEDNKLLLWMRKHLHITPGFHGTNFFMKLPHPQQATREIYWATPLFVTLVMVEVADLVFAVDSIPAIFAITTDSYIVFTSNICAILGLRSLYFTLQAMVGKFMYLSQALSLVLMFVGGKIIYEHFFHDKIDIGISLGVIIGLISAGMVISILHDRHKAKNR